jgi:outer membrane protein assembly factor BamB
MALRTAAHSRSTPGTGETVWSRELLGSSGGGIDIAPTLFDSTVPVSTVPATRFGYVAGVMGTVWALDAGTGAPKWQFNTVQDTGLWGHPELNSGGGIWYPPAVDGSGRVFLAVANPAPFPGTAEFPNGSSRPGPNLYTNSLVALDGQTGSLLWYRQAVPHDIRDQDLEASPIVTNVSINGTATEVVIVAGKMGVVYAHRADTGAPLWTLPVGRHQNDVGDLPPDQVTVFPGLLGGVIAPMALARGRLLVSWLDRSTDMSSTTINPSFITDLGAGTGALAAVDPGTGQVLWQRGLPKIDLGGATVSNDVVFTSTYDGTIYAFDVDDGTLLWTDTARAGINSFPAIAGDMVFIGAAAPGFFQNPVQELIAYGL